LPGLGRRFLVVATLSDHARLLSDGRAAAKAGADALEVRADCFPKSVLQPERLRDVLEALRKTVRLPIILTLRSGEEGGRLSRRYRELDRLSLIRAALSEAAVVDIEMSAGEINHHVVMEAHKRGKAVILSHHDFRRTPPNAVLRRLVLKARRLRGDILKLAVLPRRAADVDRFLEFARRAPVRHRAFLAMGRLGRVSRLEGFRWGSCLTYGFVRRRAAPGQTSVRDLVRHLRSLGRTRPA
jgi:3-dehydroquinate dehydratase-1